MKIEKKILIFIMVVCLLFSIAGVCASEANDTALVANAEDNLEISEDNQFVNQTDELTKTDDGLLGNANAVEGKNIQNTKDDGNCTISTEIVHSDENVCGCSIQIAIGSDGALDSLGDDQLGDFNILQNLINNAQGDSITLDRNYTFTVGLDENLTEGIIVNKSNLVINGNGYTIDALGKSRIFHVIENEVRLTNITFINANNSYGGGAIYWSGGDGSVVDCSFVNNSADRGGAIYWSGGDGSVVDCSFASNSGTYGGAIYGHGSNGLVERCSFMSNYGFNGGIIYWDSDNGTICSSKFIKNNGYVGPVIYFDMPNHFLIVNDSIFIGNDDGNYDIFGSAAFDISEVIANNNWFGNTFKNRQTVLGSFRNTQINNWLYLDADVDLENLSPGDSLTVNYDLYKYDVVTGESSLYDASNFPTITFDVSSEFGLTNVSSIDFVEGHASVLYSSLGNKNDLTISNSTFYLKLFSIHFDGSGYFVDGNVNVSGDGSQSSPFKTLKEALDVVSNGDTIFIASGTYTGWKSNVGLEIKKEILITSYNGGSVIFDGQNSYSIFYVITDNLQIRGMTFVNAFSNYGGAIRWTGNNGVVANCSFINSSTENEAGTYGGALYCKGEDIVVANCTFVNNRATDGGALYWKGGNGVVTNCSFINNVAFDVDALHYESSGGAIVWDGDGAVTSSIFINNKASFAGAILTQSYRESLYVKDNIFINNTDESNYVIYAGSDSFIVSDFNWFGNTYDNRNVKPKIFSNTIDICWLYLNVDADFNNLTSGDSLTVNYDLYCYDSKEGTSSVYNASNFPTITFDVSSEFGLTNVSSIDLVEGHASVLYTSLGNKNDLTISNGAFYLKLQDYVDEIIFEGPNYYVDGSVNVSGDGSQSSPFKTLIEALNVANDGSVISIASGIYTGLNSNVGLNIKKTIKLEGYGDNPVVFDGQNSYNILSISSSNVVISGITFVNAHQYSGGAIVVTSGTNNSLVDCCFINCTSDMFGGAVVWLGGTISSSIFINNSALKFGNAIYGVTLYDDPVVVKDCIFINNSGCESDIFGVGNVVMDFNWFGNNAMDYETQPTSHTNSNIYPNVVLFLNATANPNPLSVVDSSDIVFKLYAYNRNSTEITDYDNSLLKPVNLTITSNNGTVDRGLVNLGGVVKYTPTNFGIDSVTASIENVEYSVDLIIVPLNVNLSADSQIITYGENATITLNYNSTATGKVNITLTGKKYNKTYSNLDLNSKITFQDDILPDEYNVAVVYCGNHIFSNAEAYATLTVTDGTTFWDLNRTINSNEAAIIDLNKNYSYYSGVDSSFIGGIVISRNVAIDGHGMTIDGTNVARIFNVTNINVILQNINFINGYADYGGAIYWDADEGKIINSSFRYNKISSTALNAVDENNYLTLSFEGNENYMNAVYLASGNVILRNVTYWNGQWVNSDDVTPVQTTWAIGQDIVIEVYSSGNLVDNITFVTDCNGQIVYDYIIMGNGSYDYKAYHPDGGYYTYIECGGSLTLNDALGDDFNSLQTYINRAKENTTVTLRHNYTYTDGLDNNITEGIVIDKPLTIEGNGYTIDAKGKTRIFNITDDAEGVVLKNISFTNGKANQFGGAIYWNGINGSLTDCIFTDNYAIQGGAIYWVGDYGNITCCNFTDNEAANGGALNWWDSDYVAVTKCNFDSNKASVGAAIYWDNDGSVSCCSFVNNSASGMGGAIDCIGGGSISDCDFVDNSAIENGGAIYSRRVSVSNCSFVNNSAGESGGAIYWFREASVSNCSFVNNSANVSGGAVYNDAYEGYYIDCNFANNSAGESGGAIYSNNYLCSVSECNFVNNSVSNQGGAIYLKIVIGNVNNSSFRYNKASSANLTPNVTDTHLIFTFEGNENYMNAIYLEYGNVTFSNVTYWDGEWVNSDDVIPVQTTQEAGQNIALEIYNFEGLVESIALVTNRSGQVEYNFMSLLDGDYSYVAYHWDDAYYTYADAAGNFTRKHIEPNFTVSVSNITFSENVVVNVELPIDVTGDCDVTIADKVEHVNLTEGKGSVEFAMIDAGVHTVVVTFYGDDNYINASVNAAVKVNKAVPEITVSADSITYGKVLVVNVEVTGNISRRPIVIVGNESKAVTLKNGVGTAKFSGLAAGTYDIAASYNGDANYAKASASASVKVNRASPKIKVSADPVAYGEDVIVNIQLPGDVARRVIAEIDGESKTISLKGGVGAAKFSGLAAGIYDITVSYNGDGNYLKASKNATVKVKRAAPEIVVTAKDIKQGEDLVVNVQLPGDIARRAIVTVNGEEKLVSLTNGAGTAKFSGLTVGTYAITVSYHGDVNYVPVSVNATVIVNTGPAPIEVTANPVSYGEDIVIDVQLPADVARRVNITFGNVSQLVSLKNGSASLKVSGLDVGTYDVKVYYGGDANYLKSAVNTTVKVNKVTPEIQVTAEDISYGDALTVGVVLPADVSKRAAVVVEGVEKYVTLKSGVGIVKFMDLSVGTHEITVSYVGDANYKKASCTTIIEVKE